MTGLQPTVSAVECVCVLRSASQRPHRAHWSLLRHRPPVTDKISILSGHGNKENSRRRTLSLKPRKFACYMWEGNRRHTGPELHTGGMRGSKPAGFSSTGE